MSVEGARAVVTDERRVGRVPVALRSGSMEALLDEAVRLGRDPALAEVDDDQLLGDLCRGAAELAASTCRWLTLLGEVVVRGLWAVDGARTPGVWLSFRLGIGPSTAREHVRVALALRELPLVHERFSTGTLSYSKVRAITRVAETTTQELLLRWADAVTAAELESIVADTRRLHRASMLPADDDRLGLRRRWRDDGLLEVTIVLDPADGIAFEQRIDRLVDVADAAGDAAATRDADDRDDDREPGHDGRHASTSGGRAPLPVRAAAAITGAVADAVAAAPADTSGVGRHLAVVELAAADVVAAMTDAAPGDGDGDSPGRPSAHPDLGGEPVAEAPTRGTSDADAIAPATGSPSASAGAALVGSGRGRGRRRAVPLRQIRRLLCGAAIDVLIAAIDRPVDLGRTRRYPDARLRRLVLARDGRCRAPGCAATRWLHLHHVVPWEAEGPTDLDNLVALCGFHHRLVHAHRWVLRPNGSGRWTFHRTGDSPAYPDSSPPPPPLADSLLTVLGERARSHDIGALRPADADGFGYDHDLTVAVLRDRLETALPPDRRDGIGQATRAA